MANTAGHQASIGNGQTMNADAARYWLALVAAIKASTGIVIVPTEGTRTYARQRELYQGWVQRRKGFNAAWSPDSPYAYHLSGRAVDVGSQVGYTATRASREFYARAGQYGFRPTVKGETWHFEWRADWVGVSLEVAAIKPLVIPTPEEEDTMPAMILNTDSGAQFAVSQERLHYFSNEAEANTFRAVTSIKDELHRLNTGQCVKFFEANGIPGAYADHKRFLAERPTGDWSLATEIRDRGVKTLEALGRVEAALKAAK